MATVVGQEADGPIIIYRTVNRDGQTFGLEPGSLHRLRSRFGQAVQVHPRVFIAHDSMATVGALGADLARQVVRLLTGVAEKRLEEFGGVSFRDPATDDELVRG